MPEGIVTLMPQPEQCPWRIIKAIIERLLVVFFETG